jgi:hypothetical protein
MGVDGLCLIGRHQRTAAGITQQHYGFRTLRLAQPPHSDADVDKGVIKQKTALVPAIPGVPAQEANTAGCHVVGEVVLGEVDLIMSGDHRDLWLAPHTTVVETLARMPTCACPPGRRRIHPDELACNAGRSGCRRCLCHVSAASLW